MPKFNSAIIPSLLYAKEAVFIPRIMNGLNGLVDLFVTLMDDIDLDTNISKTQLMICGRQSSEKRPSAIKGSVISRVSSLPYLGVTFDHHNIWTPCLLLDVSALIKHMEPFLSFWNQLVVNL